MGRTRTATRPTRHPLRIALVGLVLVLAACTAPPPPYTEEIAAWRASKDQFMQRSDESPIPPDQRAEFQGLSYYPENPDLRLVVRLKEFDTKEPM